MKEMTKACPVFTLYIEFYSLYTIIMYINIYIYIYIYIYIILYIIIYYLYEILILVLTHNPHQSEG